MTNQILESKNFSTLKNIQTKFLNREFLTEFENLILTKAMRLGFSYTSKPKNFNTL